MKKKIIITGGLGYIGTELCRLYSGVSWHHKILIIDNRFVSERVNQIRNWNMEFIHGDILDKDLVNKYFKNADVVHHLAGVTDVPRTFGEANKDQDEKIKRVGEEGTQNILDAIDLIKDFVGESVPVVDNNNNIVGIVTESDLFNQLLIAENIRKKEELSD